MKELLMEIKSERNFYISFTCLNRISSLFSTFITSFKYDIKLFCAFSYWSWQHLHGLQWHIKQHLQGAHWHWWQQWGLHERIGLQVLLGEVYLGLHVLRGEYLLTGLALNSSRESPLKSDVDLIGELLTLIELILLIKNITITKLKTYPQN